MYDCKIILDSLSPSGGRLTTFEVTFPRIVLAEFNTHRVFSRNSASSRAIPIKKQIERIEKDPYIPEVWGKNQKGMQANEVLSAEWEAKAKEAWSDSILNAIQSVGQLLSYEVHKQITNRVLEPYMWHTVIVSATHYDNFFALRDNEMADPAIARAAELMHNAYRQSVPKLVQAGEWHLPLVTGVDDEQLYDDGYSLIEMIEISAARCARTSYLTHHGKRDPQDDIRLYNDLKSNGHMSPLEHPACSLSVERWKTYCEERMLAWMTKGIPVGNYFGWSQHRKIVSGEDVYRPVENNA